MYQYKLIYPCLLLATTSVIASDEVYSTAWKQSMIASMREAFRNGASLSTVVMLVSLALLFILLVVWMEILKSRKRRHASSNLGWEKFRERASYLRLTAPESSFLTEAIQETRYKSADSVLNSPTVFENVIEHFYELKGLDNLSEEELVLARQLRERLGFARLSNEIPYVSSRQFQLHDRSPAMLDPGGSPGQPLANEGSVEKWMASIVAVNEKYWSILRPQGAPVAPGTWVRINVTRPGDAEYRIRAQVLEDLDGELRLKHTRDLSRNQLRNWVRVDVDLPVKAFKVMPGQERDRIEEVMVGRIRDLSGGGISLSLASRVEKGALLDLEFELPGHGELRGLRVRIIRVQGPLNGDLTRIVHSASFDGDYKAIQERIIHFVFEKQRQEVRLRETL